MLHHLRQFSLKPEHDGVQSRLDNEFVNTLTTAKRTRSVSSPPPPPKPKMGMMNERHSKKKEGKLGIFETISSSSYLCLQPLWLGCPRHSTLSRICSVLTAQSVIPMVVLFRIKESVARKGKRRRHNNIIYCRRSYLLCLFVIPNSLQPYLVPFQM